MAGLLTLYLRPVPPSWAKPLVRAAFIAAAVASLGNERRYTRRAERWGNRCAGLIARHVRFEAF